MYQNLMDTLRFHHIFITRLLVSLLLGTGMARAFPPAPYYTIYGDVRDEYGLLLPAEGSSVVMYQGGVEKMREALTAGSGADYNYQLRMRIDMGRTLTSNYSSLVVSTASAYTLTIYIGDAHYYPIEITARTPTVGTAASRVRLDLTLGVDSDHDGMPDAWEESQLYQGGYLPGPNGWDLSLLDRNGDLDKDGLSNITEYISGTYAGDATSTINLVIKEKIGENVRLETFALYGKSYTIEATTDLKTWAPITFATSDPAAAAPAVFQDSLLATSTGITSLYAKGTSAATYYRLRIR
jgi:hypothetical protein